MCQLNERRLAVRMGILRSLRAAVAAFMLVGAIAGQASAQYLNGSVQDARVLTGGEVEMAVSATVFPRISDGGRTIDLTGGGVTVGIGSRADLGVSATYRHNLGVSNTTIHLQPRFSLIADRLALAVPIGVDLGAKFDRSGNRYHRGDLTVSPSLLASVPLSRAFDLTGSARSLMGDCCPASSAIMSVEGGPAIHTPGDRFAVRGVFGQLFSARGGRGGWTFGTTAAVRVGRGADTISSGQSR